MLLTVIDIHGQGRCDDIVATHLTQRGLNVSAGNSVKFYTNGHDKFEDMFEDIRHARKFVHLEYFNFRNDSIAGLLFEILKQKASEGVEVRAMYDAFGNASNNRPIKKKLHREICDSGIQLVKFDPIDFPWFNHIIPRDHRKIVVIDGEVAYTGGMNVADYYITGIEGIGPWHDMHMRLTGPVVNDLQYVFCDTWHDEVGETLVGAKYYPQQKEIGHYRMAIVDRKPRHTQDAIRDLYATMIDSARHKIQIINPYFVPTHRVRQALKNAIDRGVNVEILLSAKGDIPMTPEATHYVGNNLMKRGAHVWLFNGGFHHTKIMMVDGCVCTIGSANLDARSLRCDYEINTVIFSTEVTQQLSALFDKQKTTSTEIHPGYWGTRTAWKRFVGWFGNLLTPVL